MNAIEARQLSKVFTKPRGWQRLARTTPVTAVSDLNLSIPQGELFGLLGPNGAGKTTLVKMLCTLIQPSSGTAVVAGQPLENGGAIRAAVGLVTSDERSFYWRLSARRNLAFFAAMHGLYGRDADERINLALAEVGLTEVADRRFGLLSSGMRQRLAIARSLLHWPQILFLDEPSRSLDPQATRQLHDLIRRLLARREMTVFLITHDLAEAEALCDRVALMHNGRIQTSGSPQELRRHLYPARQYTLHVISLPDAARASLLKLLYLSCQVNRIQLQTTGEDGRLTAVLDILRQHQVAIQQIESTIPTLEEVFRHYTEDEA